MRPSTRPILPSLPQRTTPTRAFSTTTPLAARLIRRPRRPYTFTQLIQLSDGSAYTLRTTSPQALYRSTKDTRNHMLWQPHDRSLRNVEVDEAGKLAAFRERYGRGFDLEAGASAEDSVADLGKDDKAAAAAPAPVEADVEEETGDLGDLISEYAATQEMPKSMNDASVRPKQKKRR